ncbi:hypothetical protein PPL_11950 [Heterostelium album PN500]|uniref:FNIP repeat-containing protein n=1 Tax=Heterostelium pallidum (strain ATCC 26659 / Pp 5 / PN500) TaxID=670386 RepID=D3BUX8_HETP5|nr:hypothetical protein PPL_11950 [Heterostelium album PN500]EFA74916.1 hypothetical protein PPL_11950 [Heterostelium album PN500]|eukprot:XP_020427050.1 hypothetical protein PPL_11950 [Heterostelium album PN500]
MASATFFEHDVQRSLMNISLDYLNTPDKTASIICIFTLKFDKMNISDKIVNLSHLILNKIISHLDQNIDRICFSFACKRWFNDRDKYLIFNTDNICINSDNNNDITQNHKHFLLPSYNNIYLKTIQTKTDCSLYFGYKDTHTKFRYDFFYDSELKCLHRLLNESQSLTTLIGCCTLKYGLPTTIKTIMFHSSFNEKLVRGSLPSSLEVVDFGDNFDQEIPPGVLPEGLLVFTINNRHYQHEIQPGVFPSSIKTINLINYSMPIKAGVLPTNLDNLRYTYGVERPLELPKSLKYLEICGPNTSLKRLSLLTNLQTLLVHQFNNGKPTLDINCLPPTIRELEFKRYRLKGTMPTSIRRIFMEECEFQFNEIFPETLQYYFEVFKYSIATIVSIPSNIKIVHLEVYGSSNEPIISLPSGIESIYLSGQLNNEKEHLLDCDGDRGVGGPSDKPVLLRELRLPLFKKVKPNFNLPHTVEVLDVGMNDLNDILPVVPSTPTIKTLGFSKQSAINIIIPNNIKSITNIIYHNISYSIYTIRKLDDSFYLIYGENQVTNLIIAKVFHQSNLEKILSISFK